MVSESKVRGTPSSPQTLLTKADRLIEGVCIYLCVHAHTYTIYVCGGEKTKGDLLHLEILSGGGKRSPEALSSATPRSSECESFNGPK